MPESIHWYRLQNRLEEAENQLQYVAKVNKRPKPEAKLLPLRNIGSNGNFIQLWSPLVMCIDTIIQSTVWYGYFLCLYLHHSLFTHLAQTILDQGIGM